MSSHRMEYAWRTDRGRIRAANEDAVAVFPESGLVIVADGIGGASAGDVASNLAVRAVSERFHIGYTLPADRRVARRRAQEAVGAANRAIWESAQTTEHHAGMGTTLVMGYACSDWLIFAYVGDSRLYRLRDGELVQLTRDHSLIQEVVDRGFFPTLEDAQHYGINRNILTRGLGTGRSVAADFGEEDLRPGDLFLFCTDGLTGMVDDRNIRGMLLRADDNLDLLTRSLVELACDAGGLDNITVALLRVS
jgi:PPM family protein phosphatase